MCVLALDDVGCGQRMVRILRGPTHQQPRLSSIRDRLQLLGVYRQEFYQYIEQISKHFWAIDDWEYIVARAGLLYMTECECFQAGNDNNGNARYASVQSLAGGRFMMGLYYDAQCLEVEENLGITYDDLVGTTDVYLSSHSGDEDGDEDGDDDGYSEVYAIWADSQEYTMTNLNEVYDTFRYCTPCMDYPTYQDGYFIGDYGTDEDDLINQCWKFHSHDSFPCEADCISLGHAQGTIASITYGDTTFGSDISGFSGGRASSSSLEGGATKMDKLKANLFIAFSGIIFIDTFLAFAVARGSGARAERSSKSRRLLDDERGGKRTHRSKSRSKRDGSRRRSKSRGGDGKSKSGSLRRSKSKSRRSSSHRDRERDRDGDYKPPERSRSKSRSKSTRNIWMTFNTSFRFLFQSLESVMKQVNHGSFMKMILPFGLSCGMT